MSHKHIPMPPVLGYISEKMRAEKMQGSGTPRAVTRPSTAATTLSSRPKTADATELFKRKIKKSRAFLKDNEQADSILPQPLPQGIPYVATFTTFDDLIDRKILDQPEEQQVRMNTDDVRLIYEAKCLDQNLKPTWEREIRFMELLSNHCQGNFFSLKENGLGHASAEAVARVLATNQTYSIVDLAGNRLRDAGAACIAQLLLVNDAICHLSLKSNDVGHEGGEALCRALERNNTVTSLDLGGIAGINRNHIGSKGAEAVGRMLKINQVMVFLNVSSNGLGSDGTMQGGRRKKKQSFSKTGSPTKSASPMSENEGTGDESEEQNLLGVRKLCDGIKENVTLTSLNLASNNLGPDGAEILASVLDYTKIKALDLQRNNLGDLGVIFLSKALPRFMMDDGDPQDHLQDLNLDYNGIKDLGMKSLAPFIRYSLVLNKLHLNGNEITYQSPKKPSGITYLAEVLKDCHSLKELELSGCNILEEHGKILAPSLAMNRTLKLLDLSHNRLMSGGCCAICDALRKNRTLETLNLGSNMIRDEGGKAISVLVGETMVLGDLNIRQNLLTNTIGDAIDTNLRNNGSIRKLDHSYNDFAFVATSGIATSLARNEELWQKNEIPRLQQEIHDMKDAEKNLSDMQGLIDDEKRSTKERSDESIRKRQAQQLVLDKYRKDNILLEERLAEIKEFVDEKEDVLNGVSTECRQAKDKMDGKIRNLERGIERDVDAKEKVTRQIESVKKQLKILREKEAEAMGPLMEHFQKLEKTRLEALADAKWQSENLVGAEFKIKQLQKQLEADRLAEKAAAAADKPAPTGKPKK